MHAAVIVQPQDDRRIGYLNEVHTARWALRPRVAESFRKRGRDTLGLQLHLPCAIRDRSACDSALYFNYCELRLYHRTSLSQLAAGSELRRTVRDFAIGQIYLLTVA